MKIYSVFEKEFELYGKIVSEDLTSLYEKLQGTECPENGTVYSPSDAVLESDLSKQILENEYFGGMEIQVGYCNGHNRVLNCLEYHKNSEINAACDDAILLLGTVQEIENGKFDTSKVKAFLLPKFTAVEIYATTLHYAPCGVNGKGFRVAIVLPKGTNTAKPDGAKDKLITAKNKWLLAHPESVEASNGAYVGLTGENIKL